MEHEKKWFSPNPQQERAIAHDFGPMLVRAGAGTGKTTVLTRRIARLICSGIASPDEILAITFTNAAAEEMRDRLELLVGRAAERIRAYTFHSLCYDILRRQDSTFNLLCKEDLWILLRQNLDRLGLRYFAKASDPASFLEALMSFFDRCNDELISVADYRDYVDKLATDPKARLPRVGHKRSEEPTREEVIDRCREIASVFENVERLLRSENAGSFGSLIVRVSRLFRDNSALVEAERARARFILVDEFQDTNHAQLEIVRKLAGPEQNVFVVGDPDQAIYRFRGASSGAFQDFLHMFPTAQSITLAENQRSTQNILDCAYEAIQRNADPSVDDAFHRKPLKSGRSMRGSDASDPVTLVSHRGHLEEARHIAHSIVEQQRHTQSNWNDFAVLYRGHAAVRPLVEELGALGIPVEVTGTDLFETEVIRDLVAMLSCMVAFDDNVNLFRMATNARFSVPAESLQNAMTTSPRPKSVFEALQRFREGERFLQQVRQLQAESKENGAGADLATDIAIRALAIDKAAETPYFRRFVREWLGKPCVGGTACNGTLDDFLAYLELWRDAKGALNAEERDILGARLRKTHAANAVQLMTVHASKGLEFPFVYVARVASQSFPLNFKAPLFDFPHELRNTSRLTEHESHLHDEEERRLFYVAVTRAKDQLTLCGKPRKAGEVPMKYMRELSEAEWLSSKIVRSEAEPYAAPRIEAGASEAWYNLYSNSQNGGLKLSASAIETYESCPKQYYFRYIWHIPGEPTATSKYGSAIHLVLKAFYDAVQKGTVLSALDLVKFFEAAFTPVGIEDHHHYQLLLQEGKLRLTEFAETHHGSSLPRVRATEQPFSFTIDDITLQGKIDRIDELGASFSITDYKTGNPKTDEQAEKSLQLAIYALATEHLYGDVSSVGFYNLATNESIDTAITEKTKQGTIETVLAVATRIKSGDFGARPKGHKVCEYCAYHALCPATEQKYFAQNIATETTSA